MPFYEITFTNSLFFHILCLCFMNTKIIFSFYFSAGSQVSFGEFSNFQLKTYNHLVHSLKICLTKLA